MLNIMYHYVRPDNRNYPFFKSINICTFRKQLDYFEKEYGFLSKKEYKSAVRSGNNPKGVVLTFDDGFKDHFNYVLPELEARGLWGIFYISTGVYQKNKLLGVHRVHYLKGKFGAKLILDEALKIINNDMLDHNTMADFSNEAYAESNYEQDERRLGRLFNYHVNYKYRDKILDQLMDNFFDEDALFKEVYLSVNEVKGLILSDNIVGAHTVSHKVLSRLSYQDQFDEIKRSFDFIDEIFHQDYKSFCYPYGYKSSYNEDTLEVLSALGVDDACVFDDQPQGNEVCRFQLSRVDCNKFMSV